jgi:hypothetical protein
MPNIYDQHKAAFSNVSAYCVLDKAGNRVASIAFKFPRDGAGRLYAYVHVFGGPMVRGFAGGGGYDKRSAAVLSAVSKMKPADYYAEDQHHVAAFKGMVDCGYGWDRQLQDAGYTVLQAV